MSDTRAAMSTDANRKGRGPLALTEGAWREATMLVARNEPGTRWTHHIAATDLDPLRCGTADSMALMEALASFIVDGPQ